MEITSLLFLIFAILLNSSSSIFYKWSSQSNGLAASLLFITGITLGAVNAFFYTKSLKKIALDIAYPVFSAGSIALVALISIIIFSEKFSFLQGIGVATVLVGIILITSA